MHLLEPNQSIWCSWLGKTPMIQVEGFCYVLRALAVSKGLTTTLSASSWEGERIEKIEN